TGYETRHAVGGHRRPEAGEDHLHRCARSSRYCLADFRTYWVGEHSRGYDHSKRGTGRLDRPVLYDSTGRSPQGGGSCEPDRQGHWGAERGTKGQERQGGLGRRAEAITRTWRGTDGG